MAIKLESKHALRPVAAARQAAERAGSCRSSPGRWCSSCWWTRRWSGSTRGRAPSAPCTSPRSARSACCRSAWPRRRSRPRRVTSRPSSSCAKAATSSPAQMKLLLSGGEVGGVSLPATAGDARPVLDALDKEWQKNERNAGLVIAEERNLIGLGQAVRLMNERNPALQELADEVVGAQRADRRLGAAERDRRAAHDAHAAHGEERQHHAGRGGDRPARSRSCSARTPTTSATRCRACSRAARRCASSASATRSCAASSASSKPPSRNTSARWPTSSATSSGWWPPSAPPSTCSATAKACCAPRSS